MIIDTVINERALIRQRCSAPALLRVLVKTLVYALVVTTPVRTQGQVRAAACCTITAIDTRSGVVSARVSASGEVFEFTSRAPNTLSALRVGQAVHANFTSRQVSLDGRATCCTVTKGPTAPAATRVPSPAPSGNQGGNQITALPATTRALIAARAPAISFGTPIPHSPTTGRNAELSYANLPAARFQSSTLTALVGSRQVSRTVLHLYGLDGVENAPASLPEGVKRILEIHARKTMPGELTHYIVDPQIAGEWAATHEVPEEIKVKTGGKKCKGSEFERYRCRAEKSWDNLSELTSAEWERLRKRAEGWWEDVEKTMQQCGTTDGWKDHVASGPTVPVPFSITPSMTVNMEQSGSRGSTRGTLRGSVGLGFPMESDLRANVSFFYIPCLPGVYRLRALGAEGTLTVTNQLSVDVTASGAFSEQYTIPPTGGAQIPLYVIPIVIGQVPVAVIDVSAYIEGDVRVHAEGTASGRFGATNSQRTNFAFECSGRGCKGSRRSITTPTTTNQSAQIEGKVSVQPGIFTALQLSLNYNVLQGRAGPEPFVLAVANGCGAASATQTTGAGSTSETNVALTADLDWGVLLRAEALVVGERVGQPWEDHAMQNRHLWFSDLAPGGSTALIPRINGPTQAAASQPVAVRVRMPDCYPYASKVRYRINWDGVATPAPDAACEWARRTCTFNPHRDLLLALTWPAAGTYTITVQLEEDEHDRTFTPRPPPARLTVTVGGGGNHP
ncbi:MAG: hypothetical protein ACT4OZ_10080 [Gemmatimonadota bacterium]